MNPQWVCLEHFPKAVQCNKGNDDNDFNYIITGNFKENILWYSKSKSGEFGVIYIEQSGNYKWYNTNSSGMLNNKSEA